MHAAEGLTEVTPIAKQPKNIANTCEKNNTLN